MKNKIAIIVTWFGDLPAYFSAWLKSAERNVDIDFYLFFDRDVYSNATNIHFIRTTMQNEITRISEKIGEVIKITDAYKFCDLRPSFGIGYQEYLKDYNFWGYCDIDMVFGNIRSFLTDEVLDEYERLYNYGHLTIFRNNSKMNDLYSMKGCIYTKDDIFRGKAKCTPEEEYGINRIMKCNDIKWYKKADYADFYIPYETLVLNNNINYENQVFYWEDGHAYRAYVDNGEIKTTEYVYVHWQKRKPVIENEALENEAFFITANKLITKERGVPNVEQIKMLNPPLTAEEKKRSDKLYLKKKLHDFVFCSWAQKKIWIRQKYYFFGDNKRLVESKL